MKFAKITALLLALCFLLCACSSEDSGSTHDGGAENDKYNYNMQLIYDETDSLNPFLAESKQNKEICLLLYDPLVTIDNEFSPVYKIAETITVSGKNCTVRIKNIKFTDNTALTATDIVYSLELARNSANYKAQLGNVASVDVVNQYTVSITLQKADPYFANLLDFPIIKTGSDTLKSIDNIALPPVGCGRYILDEKKAELNANGEYYGGEMKTKRIGLINAPDAESAEHYISAGAVSVCYDDYGDNALPRMSGIKQNVPLNNLVYVGVNMRNAFLRDKYLRYAISSAINRSDIVKDAYYDNATAANGPFNPLWKEAEGFQTIQIVNNREISIENLEKIGYNSMDNEGYRLTSSGKRISLSLLVNSDNSARVAVGNAIVKQLADVGIEIKLEAVPYDVYLSRLKSGSFELYLAEVRLLNNMDLSSLVTPGGSMAFGIAQPTVTENEDEQPTGSGGINLTASAAVSGFYSGQYTLGDVATAFISEMPIIPLCYRSGVIMLSHKLKTEAVCSAGDIFFNVSDYSFNN
ncbi:MAG: hypothetical protein IKL44_00915 [Clostridia bacterium]|nr:hypothetical protein [Clostridia bacterium]